MRHRKRRLQLNRFTSWRQATLVSLAKNLLIHQSIKTTQTKSHAVKPVVDRLISLAKQNSLFAKRQAFKILNDHKLVSMLFNDLGQRFKNKTGGYTRILKLGLRRRGDNAGLVMLELTEKKIKPRKLKKQKEAKAEEEIRPAAEKPEIAKERPSIPAPVTKKPPKKFLGGLRKIFKKERDSL